MWRTHLLQDFRYALRLLRKTPVFTAAAVLILGCATGSNLAVFSLVDALMLRAIRARSHE
jgi:putative ABC transport system permease protein